MPNQTACARVTLFDATASLLLLRKEIQLLLAEPQQSEEPASHDDERTVFPPAIGLERERPACITRQEKASSVGGGFTLIGMTLELELAG